MTNTIVQWIAVTFAICRFTATIPSAAAEMIVGTVVGGPNQLGGEEVGCRWSMSRR